MITEEREFFEISAIAKALSVNLDNLKIKFNSVDFYREDDDSTITVKENGRRVIVEKSRCMDGIHLKLSISNEEKVLEERMDWLQDEEYELSGINLEVSNASTGEVFEVFLDKKYGEQIKKIVEIEVDPNIKKPVDYLCDCLTDGNWGLKGFIYNTISSDKDLQDIVNGIIDIPVI